MYTAISFAPVQGFIEKSRKLRDLFGASLILSHLTSKLIEGLIPKQERGERVISPGLLQFEKGMPNKILLKGEYSSEEIKNVFLLSWKNLLTECKKWLQENVQVDSGYQWERHWRNWGNHAWEVFWGVGDTPDSAMKDLENRKLSRRWTAINWQWDSSSLSGADGIVFPNMSSPDFAPQKDKSKEEKKEQNRKHKEAIDSFYRQLAEVLDDSKSNASQNEDDEPEGKFIDSNERLSIPELVKRLVTREDIAEEVGISQLHRGFKEIRRIPEKKTTNPEESQGQWTGWFMGDGDKVGDYVKGLYEKEGEAGLRRFSHALRDWGKRFQEFFPSRLGRVIYAGGDDFLGVIYSKKINQQIPGTTAVDWLRELSQKWQEHKEKITLSVGFVWAAPRVPQRDLLQHCRQTEKLAKSLGRDRVTIRVLFNSGQYVQWSCPWNYLHILTKYQDREGIGYRNGDFLQYEDAKGNPWDEPPNWSHVYTDLAHLKARHVIDLNANEDNADDRIALKLFDLYFRKQSEYLTDNSERIIGKNEGLEYTDVNHWIDGLIQIGWHLCS
ncbi:MAG: type III-B CRISPR-associated protein Cas10/Cmr2 [Spirulinaceae cyanobacterium]